MTALKDEGHFEDCAECGICSNEVFEVRHPHISTLKIISMFDADSYMCPLCKHKHCNHLQEGSDRLRMLMGSSTLFRIWKVSSYAPFMHVDFDCIVGGKINDVHASFLYQYSKVTNPMDIVIACGVNNIMTDDCAADIIFQFKQFISSIKQHSKAQKNRFPSKVVLATIPFAPKYTDPMLTTRNMKEKVRKVNAWIKEFNDKESGQHLNLHLYGVKGNPNMDPIVHKYNEWREESQLKKLHLRKFVKDRISVELIDIFRNLRKMRLDEILRPYRKIIQASKFKLSRISNAE